MTVEDRDLGYADVVKALRGLGGARGVLVGYPASTSDDEILVIAASNEFGTADGRIPERSTLRAEVDENRSTYAAELTAAVDAALGGADIDAELSAVGERAVGRVQTRMTRLSNPPNAPSTIAKKGTDNPLIYTGDLRRRLSYELE